MLSVKKKILFLNLEISNALIKEKQKNYMKKLIIALSALVVTSTGTTQAQSVILDPNPWSVGVGINFLENSGHREHQYFSMPDWNAVPYPSVITLSRNLGQGFSVEAAFSYNQELAGQVTDEYRNPTTEDYSMFDVIAKYNLHCFFKNYRFPVQPYILGGVGFNYVFPFLPHSEGGYRAQDGFIFKNFGGFGSVDAGIGFDIVLRNIFPNSTSGFCRRISFSFQTMGKWTDDANDFIENTFVIKYRIPQKVDKPQLL